MDELRLFISVNLDSSEIQSAIGKFQKNFIYNGIKLVKPDQFHLTLHFLGDSSHEIIPKLGQVLSSLKMHPFTLKVEKTGVFPSLHNIKVLWVGISEGSAELQSLQKQLSEPLAALGYTIESRPFTPHLTIGRVKFIKPDQKSAIQKTLNQSAQLIFGSQQITEIHLMQSTLTPQGSIYQSLITQELKE